MSFNQNKLDRMVYKLAKEYILSIDKITPEILNSYLYPSDQRPQSLAGIYKRMLETATNANMSPNVIVKAIGGLDELSGLLCDFDPNAVADKYDNWQELLDDIIVQLEPKGKIRKTNRSLWPRFCKTVTSGARFMTGFSKAPEFYKWVDFFEKDERARPALPMLLSYEIDGFGFPLACDFLKELGYLSFGKPDVHLKKIFSTLRLSDTENNYEVFKAIVRVSNNVCVTAYNVDKLFWLIGSGNFYNHKNQIPRIRRRDKFIDYAKGHLAK